MQPALAECWKIQRLWEKIYSRLSVRKRTGTACRLPDWIYQNCRVWQFRRNVIPGRRIATTTPRTNGTKTAGSGSCVLKRSAVRNSQYEQTGISKQCGLT